MTDKPYGDLKSVDKRQEVEIPVHPYPWPKLRPYQKAVFDNIVEKGLPLPSMRFGRHPYVVGIDVAQEDGDRSVICRAYKGRNGKVQIYFDEYANWPEYKWWRNPIKWYKWRKTMKVLDASNKRATIRSNK